MMVKFCPTFCLHYTAALTDGSLIGSPFTIVFLTLIRLSNFSFTFGTESLKNKIQVVPGLEDQEWKEGTFHSGVFRWEPPV